MPEENYAWYEVTIFIPKLIMNPFPKHPQRKRYECMKKKGK